MEVRKRSRRRVVSDINVVPYIDVMLVLLVIFMVTAPMINPGVVELPSVGSPTVPQERVAPIQITLNRDEVITIHDQTAQGDRPIALAELGPYLRQQQAQYPDQAVVIAADKDIRYEAVMKVMDTLQQQQIQKVGLLVQPQAS